MSLNQRLFQLLRSSEYVPMTRNGIGDALKLKPSETKQLKQLINNLLDEGSIARVKADKFCLPRDADLVSGTLKFRQSGSAMLMPEGTHKKQVEPLQVRAEDTWVALHGDRVLVRLVAEQRWRRHRKKGGRHESSEHEATHARVIRILQRANETLTGTLKKTHNFYYVIPDDPRIIQDILVPAPEKAICLPVPHEGDKVVVRLHEWVQKHLNPEGEIIDILGKTHEPSAEFKAILHKYKLDTSFPDAVIRTLEKVPAKVRGRDLDKRKDCRKLFTFTIDPDDAKDFDDALSIEYLENDCTRVGIHIADVSAYVKYNTSLDKEALRRGNSTYLVGCVVPMLPQALSNGICSLVETEDRLVKSVFVTFDSNAQITATEFANSVIHSSKRLTYHQAYAFLSNDDLDAVRQTPLPPSHQTGSTGRSLQDLSAQEMNALQRAIRKLWSIGFKLRRARMKMGSLELESPEVKIFVDEQGYADRLELINNDASHQLIEEFMLLANELVAKALWELNMPYISRVHDEPDAEKLNELRDYMTAIGIPTGDLNLRKEVTRLLKKIRNHPQAHTLRIAFLRSLKQACYRAENDGHYGLAKTFYAHFTSPIRRYSDLIVHRIFDHYLTKRGIDSAPKNIPKTYGKGELDKLSEHLSNTEQNSTEAERESVKSKLLEFFERELEKTEQTRFDAFITDIKNHGIFIELVESHAFGLVHISTLQDDLYRVSDDGTALIGRRQQKKYALGEIITVTVERVDRFKRQIDFRIALADSESYTPEMFQSQRKTKGQKPENNRKLKATLKQPRKQSRAPGKKSAQTQKPAGERARPKHKKTYSKNSHNPNPSKRKRNR